MEGWFARWVRSERIGAEVMIEGYVFLKDNHQMLNRSGRIISGPHQWREPDQDYKRRKNARQPFRCKSRLPHVFISPSLFKSPAPTTRPGLNSASRNVIAE